MTEPLFLADAYARETTAAVLAVEDGAVMLDRTVFYATGGGQPGDAGRLTWSGGSAAVEAAVKGAEPGAILHRLAAGAAPPPVGATVTAAIDWERRHAHMRMHTALHLLSVALPFPVTGGQIGAEKSRLDFDWPDAPGDKAEIEARLAALIAGDHPVSETWITDAELAAAPELVKTMSVKPPSGQGRVRLVRIGDAAAPVDLQPCGGTHVRRTDEIGAVAVAKIEKKGKQNRRVSLVFA